MRWKTWRISMKTENIYDEVNEFETTLYESEYYVYAELEDLARDAVCEDDYLQEQSYKIVDDQDARDEVKNFMFANENSSED
jgi:hypothetical protein